MMKAFLRFLLISGGLLLAFVVVVAIVFRDRRPDIFFAIEHGDTNMIAQYLANGGEVNGDIITDANIGRSHSRASLLHVAVSGGHPATVDFLLKRGADPNRRDWLNHTPLITAAGWRATDEGYHVMQLLLDAGADPDLKEPSHGFTPLIRAVINKRPDIVKLLISAGADPNLGDHAGATPLFYVETAELAEALIAGGANPNAVTTPADHARGKQRWEVLAVLTNAAAQPKK